MAAFTRKALQQTLLLLLETTPLDKITVKRIVDTCGISRNTFYYHYEDIPALLRDTIQAELEHVAQGEPVQDDPARHARCLLTYIASKPMVFDRIYRSDYRTQLQADLLASTKSFALASVTACGGGSLEPASRETIATFFANGFWGLCAQWLEGGAKESPEALLSRLSLFDGLLETAVQRAKERA